MLSYFTIHDPAIHVQTMHDFYINHVFLCMPWKDRCERKQSTSYRKIHWKIQIGFDSFLLKQNVFLTMHISLRRHSTNLLVYLFIFFSFCLKLNFPSLQLKFCLGQWFMKFAVKLVMVVGEFFTIFVIFLKNLIYMTSIIIYIIFCILFQRQSPVDVL